MMKEKSPLNSVTLDYFLKKNLICFYEKSFEKFDSEQQFLDNWYIDLLCEYLEAFNSGEIKNLNINIPPRFGKSMLCNVAFSMWMLGRNPGRKIISISYSATLSHKLHGYARAISNTDWYKSAFPEFSIKNSSIHSKANESETKDTQSQFITTDGGFRIASSTNGSITGEGANIIIFDDIMNPQEASSITQRESALEWTRLTAFSRFNNRKTGQKLNIQQRLSDKDFTGSFVDNTWESVVIPIKARQNITYSFGNINKIYKKGELLEPRRYGEKELKEDITLMGSRNVETQFFQETEPDDGDIFKREWFKYYIYLPEMDYYAIYADTAVKEGRDNDYSVFQCWGLLERNGRKFAYLVDSVKGKWRSSILRGNAKEFWLKWLNNDKDIPLVKFAIEDKSSGSGLIQDLEDETNIPVTKLKPDKDKVARANDITPRIESGQVLFPKDTIFMNSLERELLLFSAKKNSNKKDQVDTLTYAVKDLLFDIFEEKNKPIDYSGLL